MKKSLDYGLVKIIKGFHKGRIGNYDDESDDETKAVVYFGDLLKQVGSYEIPHNFLEYVSVSDLMKRRDDIFNDLATKNLSPENRSDLLAEFSLVENELYDQIIKTRLTMNKEKSVFISHSSKDKQFVKWLATDLSRVGHSIWLDEWNIKVGESIPNKISEGIENCDAMIVVLSENSVLSKWVENEWQTKYWDEISQNRIQVLPVLLTECNIPTLLKTKKYADFTIDYNDGLNQLFIALKD